MKRGIKETKGSLNEATWTDFISRSLFFDIFMQEGMSCPLPIDFTSSFVWLILMVICSGYNLISECVR